MNQKNEIYQSSNRAPLYFVVCLSAPSDKIGFKTANLWEGALRHRNTTELYSNNLRAGTQANQKARKQNKTQGSKQGK